MYSSDTGKIGLSAEKKNFWTVLIIAKATMN